MKAILSTTCDFNSYFQDKLVYAHFDIQKNGPRSLDSFVILVNQRA